MDKEMMKALEADGEKLRQLTGQDHGPYFEELQDSVSKLSLEDILEAMEDLASPQKATAGETQKPPPRSP